MTIEHAFGETTIESKPERIATVAWANHEVPLALGVVPVGMSAASWGDDDDDGVLPWVEDKLEELGAETPVLFDETDGIAFEAVAATQPDLILASYSGLTEKEYDTLSQIAPVVAYPDIAWATPVQDMILMSSEAMGLAEQGEQLVADLDAQVDAAYAEHPELDGKSIMFSYIDPTDLSQVGFYTTHDTRPGFLAEVGMAMPAVVTEASGETDEFYVTRSAEDLDAFDDVDIFVTYGDAEGELLDADHGRPGAVPDPRDRAGLRGRPRGVDAAGRVRQPVAAVHRLGHRRVLRPARGGRRTRLTRAAPVARPALTGCPRRPSHRSRRGVGQQGLVDLLPRGAQSGQVAWSLGGQVGLLANVGLQVVEVVDPVQPDVLQVAAAQRPALSGCARTGRAPRRPRRRRGAGPGWCRRARTPGRARHRRARGTWRSSRRCRPGCRRPAACRRSPGQDTIIGTRMPPSSTLALLPLNGQL